MEIIHHHRTWDLCESILRMDSGTKRIRIGYRSFTGEGDHMRGLILATRPAFLGGGIMNFILGAALAHTTSGTLDILALSLGITVVILVHVITHYVNDVEDVATDDISTPTPFTGGSRAIQRGMVTPALLLRVSAILGVFVALIAVTEFVMGDPIAGSLHIAILFFGYAYSGRPFMLGRRGLSEIDAALVMGLLVPLAGAHAAGGINSAALAAAVVLFVDTIPGRLGTAYPDLDADRDTGKFTIPAMVGRRGTIVVFVLAGIVSATVGIALAPFLPEPPWQRVRAISVAAIVFMGAGAIATGAAERRRTLVPFIGMGAYALSEIVLFVSALTY